MVPQKNQHVKIFLRSSMVLEGAVEEWSEKEVVIKSVSDGGLIIIHSPIEDIMVTKIVTEPDPTDKTLPQISQEISTTLKETLETDDENIKQMNIDQLRKLAVEQDRKIIAEKRQEHFGNAGAAKMAVPYSVPSVFCAKVPKKR